ncbi:uncharacterized protein LOC116247959 isoform X2 [Nymphaea colorata]|uniref:uncharacterized protein LOC116247959 isoform X2 n=1 Tax=Nymphaea colorata TaxID=210225 RepID=UPI00129DCF58|nr:uncharacterized protein LOC116247959 isoform X2 [Nymphaea colorata]
MPPKRKSATTPSPRVATRASTRSSARRQKTSPAVPPPEEESPKIVPLSPEAAENPSQQSATPPRQPPSSEQPDVAICEVTPQPKQSEDVSPLAQHVFVPGLEEAEPIEVVKPQPEAVGAAQEVVLETVVVETKMEIVVEGNEGGHELGSVNQDEEEVKEGTREAQQEGDGKMEVEQVQAQGENNEREETQGEVGNREEEAENDGIEDVEVEREGRDGEVDAQEKGADVEVEFQEEGGYKEAQQVRGEDEKKEAEEVEGGVGNTEAEEVHGEEGNEETEKVKAVDRNEEENEEAANKRGHGNGEVGFEEKAGGEEAVEMDGGQGEVDGGEEAGVAEAGGGTGGEEAVEGEGGHGEEEAGDAEAGEREGEREADEAPVPIEDRKKQKEYEVFIGGLDKDVVEDDLRKVFSDVGEVVEVRLVKKSQSQKNKGFAFVRFATVEQAKKATTELKSLKINGKVCGVTRNNDNETLYLRNICKTWTTSDLLEKLKSYEIENLVDAHLIDDPDNKGKNRGYAFLEFSTHMDAVSACTKLQKRGISFGTDSPAEVAFAKSAVQPDEEVMAQVKSVFLDGLSANWDEEYVKEQLMKYGEIEKVELARDMPTAKRKDFAFVCFTTRDAALACIDGVNKDGICNDGDKVMVKASLRKPLQNRKPSARGGWKGVSRVQEGQRRNYAPVRSSGYGGRGHYYTGERGYRKEFPPSSGRAGSWQGRDFERRAPTYPYGGGRSRPRYVEENRPERHMSGRREEYPAPYPGFSSQRQYPENAYGPHYQHYETSMPSGHAYPQLSGSKRPYSGVSEEALYGRRNRGRADTGVEPVQPQGSMSQSQSQSQSQSYGSYPRIIPEDHHAYGNTTQSYGNQSNHYLSGSGNSRSYY